MHNGLQHLGTFNLASLLSRHTRICLNLNNQTFLRCHLKALPPPGGAHQQHCQTSPQHPQASKMALSRTLEVHPTTGSWFLVGPTDIEPAGLDFRIRAPNCPHLTITGF